MKIPSSIKDSAVSEVIGAVLVFAIFISIFTTVSAYYIPSTQASSEINYQAQTMTALSELNTAISTGGYAAGSVLNQYVPLGIQGGLLSPSQQTSLTYSESGMSGSLSYGVGVSFAYVSAHPTSAILNKLLETFPQENFLNPDSEVYYAPTGTLYAAGYSTQDIVAVRATTGALAEYFYAGPDPKYIALDSSSLVVADNYTLTTYNKATQATSYYFPISVISTATNSVTQTIEILNPSLVTFYVTALLVANQNIYVAYHYLSGGAIINNVTEFQLEAGSYVRTENINPTYIINSLTYDPEYNAIIATQEPTGGFFKGNPSYLVLNPSTLSDYSVSVNFSYFYKNHGYLASTYDGMLSLVGKQSPEVSLNSALIGSNGIVYFAYNITNQSCVYNLNHLYTGYYFPSSGIAGTNFSTGTATTYLVSNSQFYSNSTDNYILDPTSMAQDTSYPDGISLGSTVSTYSSASSPSAPVSDMIFSAVGAGFCDVTSGTPVSKSAGNIVFATLGIGSAPTYFVTDSTLNVETALVLNSQSQIASSQVIRDDFFNGPYTAAYDPVSNLLYVTDYNTGSVSVLSPIKNALIGSVELGSNSFPTNITVNTNNGTVYVVESHQNSIALISGNKLLSTMNLGSIIDPVEPFGISYNSETNSVYVSGDKSGSTVILNISASGCTVVGSTSSSAPGEVFFDPVNNVSYTIILSGNSYYLYSINGGYTGQHLPGLSTTYPAVGTFDSYNGYLYVTNGGNKGLVYIYIPGSTPTSFSAYAKIPKISVGSDPIGSVFDAANNLLYIANSGTSNITIIDTTNNTYFSTVWVGSGPQLPIFDSENGYIYIPDLSYNKLSVIDGGFTILHGRIGVVYGQNTELGGSIYTTGHTSFVSPVSFISEGGVLVENYTNQNQTRVLSGLPISILNSSGNIYFSYISSLLSVPGGSTDATASSLSATDLKMQVISETNNTFSRGRQFYISDVYGNQYPVEATNVYLEYFNLSLNTPYASLINTNLYNEYSGSSSALTPNSWSFNGIPITVYLNGNDLSISLNHSVQVYFVSIVSYDIGLLGV
ncbi:MAG: hypothetical protein M1327_07220 [Candidatus Thermoplasmatota archaeon]|nr:hypothetical protein [Candidatus Thermoplasmatota archaeon]